MKETITSCDRRPVCRWRVPQPNSALLPEVFVVRSSVCSAEVVGSNPNQAWNVWNAISGRAAVESKDREWNPETIQATPGPPGPDLSPVFGPRNSSFSITRSLLSWKTAPFTKPQKHLYAWGNVQSLIIVALRSWLVFHVGSVWFSLILKFSEQIHGLV